jgi:ATP-dependent helicase HrpA
MLAATGLTRLPDVERYLRAAALRLERLPRQVTADAQRMATIHELESEAEHRRDLLWLLEELRVTQLAAGEYVRPGATVRRVREALAAGQGAP